MWILVLAMIFTYLISCEYVSAVLIQPLENHYSQKLSSQADVIIVLGGGATADTPNIYGKGHLSGSAANRLLTGILLHRRMGIPIIVSGGQVFSNTGLEATIMEQAAIGLGVAAQSIITESKSLNTRQNAEEVKRILITKGYKVPVLVTSAFHMPRAVENFQQQGLAVLPYPTDYQSNVRSSFTWNMLLPSAGAFWKSCIAFREYLGLMGSFIYI